MSEQAENAINAPQGADKGKGKAAIEQQAPHEMDTSDLDEEDEEDDMEDDEEDDAPYEEIPAGEEEDGDDLQEIDTENIVIGKRDRATVDWQAKQQELHAELPEDEDEDEEFEPAE